MSVASECFCDGAKKAAMKILGIVQEQGVVNQGNPQVEAVLQEIEQAAKRIIQHAENEDSHLI